jgi:hypothetical protein
MCIDEEYWLDGKIIVIEKWKLLDQCRKQRE